MVNTSTAADLIILYFSRAFNKEDHIILCQKLFALGLDGTLAAWCADLLSDRKHLIIFGLHSPLVHYVSSGVVQGSALRSTLLNIFINDFPIKLKKSHNFFADDIKALSKPYIVKDCIEVN